ncbi:Gfo/Idh/MocA family protein [Portibacter marinus]|uniref:Gfo/Idh/MocA family protein n=1 Tax=Portibacter marinus TaxID=2898660 RepID=UPI001F36FE91|nr:Gfo/Idh/MocA family oxidoreductase [Portibacter marinus]
MSTKPSRRQFIKSSAIAGGVFSIVPRFVLGKGFIPPSDKINLGVIGLGKQGNILANLFTQNTEAQIVAGSDVWTGKRKAFEDYVNELYAEHRGISNYNGVDTYLDYQDMLQRSDVDGVIIATPDHWHAIQSVDAMNKGKDVYCEKPMTLTIAGGKDMVEAANRNGTIVQIGSMQRSWDRFKKAQEVVSSGKIGEIKRVLVNVGDPAVPYDLNPQPIPEGIDWNRWCGPAPKIGYHDNIAPAIVKTYPDWRKYEETGGGILADWGAHMFDIAQWCLDMDHTGPVKYIPPTDPKATRGLKMIYVNGVEMNHEDFGRGWGVRFIGTEGILDVSRGYLESLPANILNPEGKIDPMEAYRHRWNHYQDWLSSMKTRSQPICPVEVGHRTATICNIANITYDLGRTLEWDPVKEEFVGDEKANAMQSRKPRAY